MKKITLWLFALFASWQMNGQVNAYSFTQTSGTYTEITGGTVLGTGTVDDTSYPAIPIGFNFVFGGTSFTDISVNANGMIALGTTISYSYTPLSDGFASNNSIAALGDDLQGNAAGELSYLLTGSAPNQVLTVQWKNYRAYNTTGDNYNFQVKLYETTNNIDVVYGAFTKNATAQTNQVGLRGASNAVFNNRTTATDWSATTAGAVNTATCTLTPTVLPTSGLTFSWAPPSCAAPGGLNATSITATSATIGWNAAIPAPSGYEYVVSTSNTTPSGSGTATTNLSEAITSLLPQTTYYVFVRSNCGGPFSSWNSFSFITACAPITTFPSLEPFATFLPNQCWSQGDGGDLTAGPATFGPNGFYTDGFGNVGFTGAFAYNIYLAAANDWVISPEYTIPAVGYELKFDAAAANYAATTPVTNWESDDTVEVLVSTTGTTNWTVLYTYNDSNVPSNTGTLNVIDLDAYSGQTVRFAYRVFEGTANGPADLEFSIDNFEVRLSPTCPDQTGLVIGAVTATTADVSWADLSGNGAIGYEYAITTSATPPASGTAIGVTFYSASSLSPQTVYYLHVRATCAASTFGNWATATFTTACAPIVALPWIENFDSVTTPAFPPCWFEQNGDFQTSNSTFDNTPRSGANYLRDAWFATNEFMWTPGFDLVAGTSYDFSSWVQGDGGTGWVVDYFVNTVQNSAAATQLGATYNVPGTGTLSIQPYAQVTRSFVPATTGTYYFAVRVNQPSFSPNYVAFDDFELKLSPACPTPSASASGVTDVVANLSWSAVPSAALGYEYVLDNVATDPVVAGTSTTSLTYAASGLTPLTTYYFHIRSVCSAGTYSTWSTVSFTTLATPPVNDNCGSATVLVPGATFAANPQIATNVGATNSAPTPAPTCGIFAGGDVWYTVTVPASGNITIETQADGASPVNDTQFTVYSGSCGAFTQVACDDEGGTGSFSLAALTGRTPGEILYVHAYVYNNSQTGTYQISAYDASLSSSSFDKSTFVAYPNPVKDVLNLSYKTAISNVKVINLLGQEVLNAKTNTNDVQVNMSALTAGAYIVNITVEDTVHTIKVIKE